MLPQHLTRHIVGVCGWYNFIIMPTNDAPSAPEVHQIQGEELLFLKPPLKKNPNKKKTKNPSSQKERDSTIQQILPQSFVEPHFLGSEVQQFLQQSVIFSPWIIKATLIRFPRHELLNDSKKQKFRK